MCSNFEGRRWQRYGFFFSFLSVRLPSSSTTVCRAFLFETPPSSFLLPVPPPSHLPSRTASSQLLAAPRSTQRHQAPSATQRAAQHDPTPHHTSHHHHTPHHTTHSLSSTPHTSSRRRLSSSLLISPRRCPFVVASRQYGVRYGTEYVVAVTCCAALRLTIRMCRCQYPASQSHSL